jgi:hypothetical protein
MLKVMSSSNDLLSADAAEIFSRRAANAEKSVLKRVHRRDQILPLEGPGRCD